jgi:hypothetical protein
VIDSVARTALSLNGTRLRQYSSRQHFASNLLLLPLRIAVSKVAMKSVMTASASFRPARTEMTSELGLVYFLVRAASRKTVKVWPVSLGLYRVAEVCVPRARPHLQAACPASRVVWRGARVVANATADAAFRRAVQNPVCASGQPSPVDVGRTPARSHRTAPCLHRLPAQRQ